VKKLAAEPLTWFLLIGGVLFLGAQLLSPVRRPQIVVDRATVDTLIRQREAQEMRTLDASDRQAVAEQWVADEILWREARRLGLDRDDAIRRALILKMRSEITGAVSPPSEAELRRWFDDHQDSYVDADGRPADFDSVRPSVQGDWLMEQSREAVNAEVARLRGNYEIVVEAG